MKKLLAILLGGAMFASALAGLVGCKDDHEHVDVDPKDGKCDVCGEDMTELGPVQPENPTITRRADPRAADAFEAYDHEGTKVGGYKTIADAINAVVEADLDYFEDEATAKGSEGGYVLKKGETQKIFRNKKGFTEENNDQFWYYQDGNALAGYNCWDDKNTVTSIGFLRNKNIVTHQIGEFGLVSVQSWNGFDLLDEHGEPDTECNTPASWVFSSPLDTGVIAFPSAATAAGANGTGMSKASYKLDLSDVKITPPYEGEEDPVYAFMGFYIWNPEYVLAVGIACDTTTGQWYQFHGSSRNDSFSDVEYKVGECLMESTWNKDGYFTPNGTDVDMTIQTVKHVDEELDEEYYTCELEVAIKDGKTLKLTIDDEFVAPYSTKPVGIWNDYMFIAGLDIKNEIVSGTKVENTDYFNGAKFEDLCVTKAEIYFPTQEELSDLDYTVPLSPDLRGKTFDFLLANDVESNGLYAYTIVNNCTFADYKSKDGADYYSFKFDGNPVGESALGGELKEYQDKIDSLKAMTVENFQDYEAVYDEVGKLYGSDETHTGTLLTAFHLNVLDFTAYVNAQAVYLEAMKLTDEGKAVLADLNALSLLANYPYLGWEAPEGTTDIAGYLWTEAKKFNEINTKFKALDKEEQGKVIRLSAGKQDHYDAWDEFYATVNEYLNDTTATSKSYTIAQFDMPTPAKDVTYDGTKALQALFQVAYEINSGEYDPSDTAKKGTLNSDVTGNFQRGFHILFLMKQMEEADVTIPDGFLNNVFAQITSTDRATAFVNDFNDYIYPVLTLAGQIYKDQQEGKLPWLDAKMAEFVNTYMIDASFSEGGFAWNLTNNKDFRDGNTFYEQYFGLPDATAKNASGTTIGYLAGSVKYITDIVLLCDDKAELTASGIGFVAEVTPLEKDPTTNSTAAATAILDRIKAFTALESYAYKGWTTTETDKTGYIYSELEAFRTLVDDREKLPTIIDKAHVSYQLLTQDNKEVKASYDGWVRFSAEMKVLEDSDLWKAQCKAYNVDFSAKQDYTAAQALANIFYGIQLRKEGKVLPDNGLDWTAGTDFDDENYFASALYLTQFYDFFVQGGCTLPTIVTTQLKGQSFNKLYEETIYPAVNTVKIAERIGKGEITKMEDLTADELAFLNEVWTASYVLKGNLATQWPLGQMETYWSDRIARVVLYAGGTLANEGTALKFKDYVAKLAKFLQDNNYTANSNGWGTTSDTILGTTLSENAIKVVGYMKNLGNITSYNYLGWEAPDGEPIAGYLLSEAKYYLDTVKPIIDALEETEKEGVILLIGTAVYEAWESLAPDIKALSEDATFAAFKVTGAKRDRTATQEYTAGDAIGEILTALAGVDSHGIDSDNNWPSSLRIYFFVIEFEEAGIELPEYLTKAIAAKENSGLDAGLNSADLKTDVKYLRTVLKIAKMLIDDPDLKITQDIIDMVNDTMVGKMRFTENGLNWNYTSDPNHDLYYRGSDYKVYYGLEASHTFKDLLESVIKFLVANGATATDTGYGVTEAMTLPTE